MSTFDVLTATLKDLQDLLQAKKCTSVELIHIYLVSPLLSSYKPYSEESSLLGRDREEQP